MPSVPIRIPPSGLALAVLFLFAGKAAAGPVNPHGFMAKEGGCTQCHARVPVTPSTPLVRDIVTICWECHFERIQEVHPVDIRPRRTGNITLKLDEYGTITCVTCHDPHGPPYADIPYTRQNPLDRLAGILLPGGYRTYFLRIPNDRGQICFQCHSMEELTGKGETPHPAAVRGYRGSGSCLPCHGEHYDSWTMTLHARTLRDPVTDPGAIEARFTGEETFNPGEAYRTVGNHWTQRYLLKSENAINVARDVWSVVDGQWSRTYWREQSWRELCAGCHYTGYNPYLNTWVEEGVGCESCHGPGGEHADTGLPEKIVNPGRLGDDGRDAICASCHTHGHDRTGEFRYPVGYAAGEDLTVYFKGLIPKKGQKEDTFRDDGTLEDRIRSFRFWISRFFARKGVNCTLCKSFRVGGEAVPANTEERQDMTTAEYCFSCHREVPAGTAHEFSVSSETDCYRCHGPMTDPRGRVSIHDHKFVFPRASSGGGSG